MRHIGLLCPAPASYASDHQPSASRPMRLIVERQRLELVASMQESARVLASRRWQQEAFRGVVDPGRRTKTEVQRAVHKADGDETLWPGQRQHPRHAEVGRACLRDPRRDRRPADRAVQGPAGVEVRRRSGRRRRGAVRGVERPKNFSALVRSQGKLLCPAAGRQRQGGSACPLDLPLQACQPRDASGRFRHRAGLTAG